MRISWKQKYFALEESASADLASVLDRENKLKAELNTARDLNNALREQNFTLKQQNDEKMIHIKKLLEDNKAKDMLEWEVGALVTAYRAIIEELNKRK